jgi:hypothetical protein
VRQIRLFALGATVGTLLAFPAQGMGVVTIGSNLSFDSNASRDCGVANQCTFGLLALGTSATHPASSPVNGTIVRWRIRVGTDTSPTALRVLRRTGNLYSGAGTSATVTPPLNATTPFGTQLPIQIGDQIGINCCDNGDNGDFFVALGGAATAQFNTRLPEGGPGIAPNFTHVEELLINADIEPTSALGNLQTKPKKKGKVRVSMQVPNRGTLIAGDARDPGVRAAAAAKKPKLLKQQVAEVGGPGPLTIILKPTKAAKALLAEGRRPKAKLKLAFTPAGGSASTQIVKVKLKR